MADGVAVWRDGIVSTRGEVRRDTVFEIGSVTKTLTGTLLATLALDGTVGLEDEVGRYLPCSAPSITLLDLATHTSGLPRLPDNLWSIAEQTPDDPYRDYRPQHLYDAIATVELGSKGVYSNFGFTLLGHVLGLAAGTDYEKLVEERILTPLSMTSTSFTLEPTQGHGADGTPAPPWCKPPTMAGAGGVRSTIDDMAIWLEASREPGSKAIAMATSQQRGRMGLGWLVGWAVSERTWSVTAHNGASGGFSAFVGWHPPSGHGTVVLASRAMPHAVDAEGLNVIKEMVDG